MSEQISQRRLRTDFGRIMRALDEGRTFTLTCNGRPVGQLRPFGGDGFVDAVAVADVSRRAPLLGWQAMREDLDRHADQEIAPRA